MSKIILAVTLVLFSCGALKAQEAPSQNHPLKAQGISLAFLGITTFPIGISVSQMITQRMSLEMGAGTGAGGIGFTYFITDPGISRLNYYTGLSGAMTYNGFAYFYLPIGVTYFGKRNFQYSIDVGATLPNLETPFRSFSSDETERIIAQKKAPFTWFSLKVGCRFGEDLKTMKKNIKPIPKNSWFLRAGADDPWLGIGYERLFGRHIGADVQLGLLGASAGAKLYFPGIRTGIPSFYVGVSRGIGFPCVKTYFPWGMKLLIGDKEWISVDAGPCICAGDFWGIYKALDETKFLGFGFSIKAGELF